MNRVYRSRKNRIIAGVAAGLADYFDVDVALVRLIWVLTVLLGGAGVLTYIIAWVVIPEEKGAGSAAGEKTGTGQTEASAAPGSLRENVTERDEQARQRRRRNAGLLLIGLGLVFLAREVLPWNIFRHSWPVLLIILGMFFLVRDRRENSQ